MFKRWYVWAVAIILMGLIAGSTQVIASEPTGEQVEQQLEQVEKERDELKHKFEQVKEELERVKEGAAGTAHIRDIIEAGKPRPIVAIASIFMFVGLFLVLGAIVICPSYFAYKRSQAMIDKGMSPVVAYPIPPLLRTLKAGIITFAAGLSITVVLVLTQGLRINLLFGIIPLTIGIGLIVYYIVARRQENSDVKSE